MTTKHLKDLTSQELELFLIEEMASQELDFWQNHYENCLECKQYLNNSSLNQHYTKIGEESAQSFSKQLIDPKILLTKKSQQDIWENLDKQCTSSTEIFLRLKRENQIVREESIVSKAAGVALANGLPEELPISSDFLNTPEISLNFDLDPISNHLYISFNGGSAQLRSLLFLKVFYKKEKPDFFYGKDIMAYGSWFINAEKAKQICEIELIYQSGEENQ